MKRHFTLLVTALLLFLPAPYSHAQGTTFSTEGTEFYVTFDDHYTGTSDAARLLYLSSRESGTASITWPNGTVEDFSLSANSITTVDATSKGIASSNFGGTVGISNRSARISASVPISVYGASVNSGTSDAFVAIPTASLGQSYRVVSWSEVWYQQISVIATQPGTTVVTITPSVNFWVAPNRTAGVPYTVQLQQGEVYSASNFDSDISGTTVSGDKKIVVISSVSSATLRTDTYTGPTSDHLVSYMPPVTSWGSSFLLPGSLNKTRADLYSIVANEDNTVVRINGIFEITLNAGQKHLYEGRISGNVQPVDVLETTKPVLVGHGLRFGSYGASNLTGDPAFSLVTPTVQFLKRYTVATPASGFGVNSLTLITLTSSVPSVLLNGAAVTSGSFTPIENSTYSIARIEVPAGNYSLSSSSGIGVYVSGFNSFNSYAYPGGFAMVNLVENPGGVASLTTETAESPLAVQPAATASVLAATGPGNTLFGFGPIFAAALVLTGSALLFFRRRASLDAERFNSH